ncbi:carboxypeptidase-like regulatory domain-containing protein [Winogradskyella sp. R77965]|uniref:carboxypeptidase-like regulatory domain-containing protein n=1 Tax=Winogradskyella sp. R77965 TaxID=3093872 RepID=UPI0037DC2114
MKFLFFLIPFVVFSQEKIAKGLVLDKVTKEPIPYVNISILDSQIGTSSDEDGNYSLTIEDADLNKRVNLSSLGYQDTTLVISKFLKIEKISLQPLVEQLDEVVISEKFENDFLEINPIRKKDILGGFGGFKNHPYIFALYIPFEVSYQKTEYLNQVKIHLNKKDLGRKSMPSKSRLRLYSVGIDSFPGKDLITKSLIIETTKKQREVIVDVSEYDIVFPESGIFVALEWLHIPFNAYNFTYTKGKGITKKKYTEIRYAPRLSWQKRKDEDYRLAVFTQGQWLQFKMPHVKENDYLIPAISLTLSN